MNDFINIAVDAMGGDNSPKKIIKGMEIHSKLSKNIFYNIFGNKITIEPLIYKTSISKNNYKIIHTDNVIEDSDSPLSAAKKGKNTSMWLSIESLKSNESTQLFLQVIPEHYLLLRN